ncbi:MAG: VCBS repeat-containing protein [Planctomycetota bacterium]
MVAYADYNAFLLWNAGDGTFVQGQVLSTTPDARPSETRRVQDYDGDGDLDLVVSRLGSITLWENLGAREFQIALRQGTARTTDAWAGDINGDGRFDLVLFSGLARRVDILRGGSGGGFLPPRTIDVAGGLGVVADFDRDDRLDVLAVGGRAFSLFVVESTLGTDSDGDGELDECEIENGATDCNEDGIPDESQPEGDLNGDGVHDDCQNQDYAFTLDGPTEIFGAPGEFVSEEYTAYIETWNQDLEPGIQGWSMSVGVQGPGVAVWASTDGTLAANVRDGGLRSSGFEQTEIIEGEVSGVTSAIVLSATQPIVLPNDIPVPVLRIGVDWLTPDPAQRVGGRILFVDGLQGSGQPVHNRFTYDGATVEPFKLSRGVQVSSLESKFLRGDANADGRVDISDGIFVLSYLFLGGERPPCLAAADADDSGALDLTDGAFINLFLFLGGTVPPAPGAFGCGVDPTRDLGCGSSGSCS